MADFTALKTAIQNAIKQNGNEEITGNLLQDVLLAIVTTLGDSSINDLITALGSEATIRGNADTTLQQNIDAEATARGQADTALQQNINAEAQARGNADTALGGRIDGVVSSIEAINNAIGNGYVYAGIATPSSTPTTGKVFYLALNAGTYTNFGNIAVTQGINILKYNGSAWSLDAFVGIDDTPTPSSNNLVRSSGVFDNIMTNGSAFDLTAYNNGTTYADLNAALTALNALPAAYKKGGMSMKYVQSSDNNYIRYNLLADSFTTDVTKWAINDGDIYIKNPEWLYVIVTSNNQVLGGFLADGSFEFSKGVPTPIKNYIEDIITTLNLRNKVDKENGKGLILNDFANSISVVKNPEWLSLDIDEEGHIVRGIRTNGNNYIRNVESETIDALEITKPHSYKLLTGCYDETTKEHLENAAFESCLIDRASDGIFKIYGKNSTGNLWVTFDKLGNVVRQSGNVVISKNDPLYLKTQFNEETIIFCSNTKEGSIERLYYDNSIASLFAASHVIISEPDKEGIAHCPTVAYDYSKNDGTFYITYYKDESGATVEWIGNKTTYPVFCKANIYDVKGTLERLDVIKANETIGDYTQANEPPYDPNLFVAENHVLVIFSGASSHTSWMLRARKYIKETNAWETPSKIYNLTLSDGDNTYDMSNDELPTFFENHGISDVTMTGVFAFISPFVYNENDEYYYNAVSGGFSNTPIIVVKTKDGLSYEFVSIAPLTMKGLEPWVYIYGNDLILIERDDNRKIKLNKMNLTSLNWGNDIVLNNSFYARPSIFSLNGEIIITYNAIPHLKTDWGQTTRTNVIFEKLNPATMERSLFTILQSNYGINYFAPLPIKGSLYGAYAEDVRQLNIGESCSDIAFSKLI